MTDLKLPTRMQVSAKPPHLRSPLDMFVLNHTPGVGGDLNWYEWREALLKALTYVTAQTAPLSASVDPGTPGGPVYAAHALGVSIAEAVKAEEDRVRALATEPPGAKNIADDIAAVSQMLSDVQPDQAPGLNYDALAKTTAENGEKVRALFQEWLNSLALTGQPATPDDPLSAAKHNDAFQRGRSDGYAAGVADCEIVKQEKLEEVYTTAYNKGFADRKVDAPLHEVDNAACILPEWSEATKTPEAERNAVTKFVAEYQGERTALQNRIEWPHWRRDLGAALLEAHALGKRDGAEIHWQEADAIRTRARDAGYEDGCIDGRKKAEAHQAKNVEAIIIPELTDVRAKDPQTWTKLDMFVAAFGPSFGDARSWRTVLRELLADYATPSSEAKWLAPGEYGEDGWVIVKRECEWSRGPGWQPSLGKILDGSLYDVDGDPWGESHDTALGWLRVEEHKVEAAQVPGQRAPGYYWVHAYNDTGDTIIAQWDSNGWVLIGEEYTLGDNDIKIVSGPITQGDK